MERNTNMKGQAGTTPDPDFAPSIRPEQPEPARMPSPAAPAAPSPAPTVEPDADGLPVPPMFPTA